jgi:hypothetical protein
MKTMEGVMVILSNFDPRIDVPVTLAHVRSFAPCSSTSCFMNPTIVVAVRGIREIPPSLLSNDKNPRIELGTRPVGFTIRPITPIPSSPVFDYIKVPMALSGCQQMPERDLGQISKMRSVINDDIDPSGAVLRATTLKERCLLNAP